MRAPVPCGVGHLDLMPRVPSIGEHREQRRLVDQRPEQRLDHAAPEQLEAGSAAELVDLLEHESMTARVLAYENLRRITDRTYQFRPEEDPGQETGKVLRWRKSQEEGQILYKTPPLPIPELAAVGPPEATGGETPASLFVFWRHMGQVTLPPQPSPNTLFLSQYQSAPYWVWQSWSEAQGCGP